MAYRAINIDPLDLESSRKAIGIQMPFSSPSAFVSTYQTTDAMKANLINYFLTGKGDRYLNPEFGNGLVGYIFEPTLSESGISALKQRIVRELAMYFPKVVVEGLDVSMIEDQHIMQLHLIYHIDGTSVTDEITVNFE